MPRQTPNPMNVIGQPSPATTQLAGLRDNRLLAAMQQQGATQRDVLAGANQRIIAGMQERGATERAATSEAGATKRATLTAKTAEQGQQGQMQMNREQIAASDRQNAAQIRASKEAREFQAKQQEQVLRLQDDMDWAKMKYKESLAREDQANADKWRQEEMDLRKKESMLNFAMSVMQYKASTGMIRAMYGQEEAEARLVDAQSKMADQAMAAVRVNTGLKGAAKSKAAELGSNASMGFDQVVSGTMATLGYAVSRDTITDKAKLQEFLDAKGLEGYLALRSAIDAAQEQRGTAMESIKAGKVKETVTGTPMVGFGATVQTSRKVTAKPEGARGSAVSSDLRSLQQIEDTLSEMVRDKTLLEDGKGTRGKQMMAWDSYYRGDTLSAIALDQKNRGLTSDQADMELLDFYKNMAPDYNAITQLMKQIYGEDADLDWLRSTMTPIMDQIFGGQAPMGAMQTALSAR